MEDVFHAGKDVEVNLDISLKNLGMDYGTMIEYTHLVEKDRLTYNGS